MKQTVRSLLALLLLAATLCTPLLTACSAGLTVEEENTAEDTASATQEATAEETEEAEEKKEETKEEGGSSKPEKKLPDPAADDELNILLIGSSACYYWVDELYGLLTSAGYKKVTLCNVYESGCLLKEHWEWLRTGEKNYCFFITDPDGYRSADNVDLQYCLKYRNWDQISLVQSTGVVYKKGEEAYGKTIFPYLKSLVEYLRERFPKAQYYWQQLWAQEIGKDVLTKEAQVAATGIYRRIAEKCAADNQMTWIPMGEAWDLVRGNPVIYEGGKNMTTRIYLGKPDHDDLSHDGDVGGGQYLNGCVAFEILTGKSCLGNSYRPEYVYQGQDLSLTAEKIDILQKAAHQAVASVYGEDFAK